MKNIDELLNSLRDHGTIDSEGSFTVSLSEARRKLTDFHSSDKQRFLILLVSGGTAAKASEIEIEQTDRLMTILFRRAYLPEAALLGAFEGQQDNEHSEAATDLILGLKSAFANDIERIEVEVTHPTESSYYWDMRPDGEETQNKPSAGQGPRILLSLHARIGVLDKARGFFRRLRGHVGMPPAVKLVDQYCDHSLIPISYKGQPLHRPYFSPRAQLHGVLGSLPDSFPRPSPNLEISQSQWSGVLSLTPGKVQVVIHGVAYCQIGSTGLAGLVYHNGLRRDLSREKIVRDEAFANFLSKLNQIKDHLFEQLALQLNEIQDGSHDHHMAELVIRFLTSQVSRQARKSIWDWMMRATTRLRPDIPANSFTANVHGLMLCFEELEPAEDSRAEVLRGILAFSSDALDERQSSVVPVLKLAQGLFEKRSGDHSLIRGYLQLGIGAMQQRLGNKKESDSSLFKALQVVWTGHDDRAQELIYLHMELGTEHMLDQVAMALRMCLEDL